MRRGLYDCLDHFHARHANVPDLPWPWTIAADAKGIPDYALPSVTKRLIAEPEIRAVS
jgi:hypothetical protein